MRFLYSYLRSYLYNARYMRDCNLNTAYTLSYMDGICILPYIRHGMLYTRSVEDFTPRRSSRDGGEACPPLPFPGQIKTAEGKNKNCQEQ